ncbi:response regulator [Catenovulum sp. 2E275]|uniref:response regulator n=1 Tax=Catenovulum sp. 2E275 TaxID=2980497 RepID=UPI0021D0A95E|nr:HD domain-containing phosphohydrolase [Catenovulum sp. 2E275]MCU4677444.1 response regulator [Catenovulum sp. 2E275]
MNQYHILIVDDVADNIQVAMNMLKEQAYQFTFALNGQQALDLSLQHNFDLILLDIMMPGMDGYQVCRLLQQDEKTKDIPIIFLTAKVDIDSISKGFRLGAVDYITKPFHSEELIARVKNHLELYSARKTLKTLNLNLQTNLIHKETRYMTELEDSQKEMIYVLMELMEATSDETGSHIQRVSEYSRLLAHYYPSLSETDCETIFHAAPMHDIGKIAIPHDILHKPGKLTEAEFEIMKTHTTKAHEILRMSKRKYIQAADVIAQQHHEKWDGSGYPKGLAGKDIHVYARIVALADVFDALIHKRRYKDAWSLDDARTYIIEQKGRHFEPLLVDLFTEHFDEFTKIAKQHD